MILLSDGIGMAGGCIPQGMGSCGRLWSNRDEQNRIAKEKEQQLKNLQADWIKLNEGAFEQQDIRNLRDQHSDLEREYGALKVKLERLTVQTEAAKKDPKLHYNQWKEQQQGMGWGWVKSLVRKVKSGISEITNCSEADESYQAAFRRADSLTKQVSELEGKIDARKIQLTNSKNSLQIRISAKREGIEEIKNKIKDKEQELQNIMKNYDAEVQAKAIIAKANADALKIKLASEEQIKQASASTQPTHITVGLPEQKNNNMMLIGALVLAGVFAFMGRSGGKSKSVVKVKA